jgi:outer membrane protein assembly factor BamB
LIWAKRYVNQGGVAGLAIKADGSFFIIGADADLGPPLGEWFAKCDADGNIVLQKTYYNVPEFFKAHLAGDGNVAIMASYSTDLMKLDGDTGAVLWARAYAYPVPPNQFGSWDSADFQVTSDGGYILAGYNYRGGLQNTIVLKTDLDGMVEWARRYDGGEHAQSIPHVVLAPDNGFYLLQDAGWQDQRIARLDPAGNLLWQKHFIWPTSPGASCSVAPAFASTLDGGCVIKGSVSGLDPANPHISHGWLAALDAQGELVWSKAYTALVGGGPGSILASPDGITISSGAPNLIRTDTQGLPSPSCSPPFLPPTPGLLDVEDTAYTSVDVSEEIVVAGVTAYSSDTAATAIPVTSIADRVFCGDSYPGIISVSRLSNPLRLKLTGWNFENGAEIEIDDAVVPKSTYKGKDNVGHTVLIAKKGTDLKTLLPKGQAVCITVRNPDGRTSDCFQYVR